MAHQIQRIIKVQPYQLVLAFNNGELRMVDLAEKIEEWVRIRIQNLLN